MDSAAVAVFTVLPLTMPSAHLAKHAANVCDCTRRRACQQGKLLMCVQLQQQVDDCNARCQWVSERIDLEQAFEVSK